MIIAFEGVDGAGKNTLVSAVEAELLAREIPVARVGFPRYEQSVHAQLAQAALYGQMGDLLDSIHGMATMFALDRAEVAEDLASFSEDGYVVLLDRFVASNAAYSTARLGSDSVADWVYGLEFDSLGSPLPDLQVLVDVDATVAQQRVAHRADEDSSRAQDRYEADSQLQVDTVAAYRDLAARNWASEWLVMNFDHGADVKQCAQQVVDTIVATLADNNGK
ncbi:Thymidylate kinase [Corynebacterium resistens DSM 45100]|uniref:Thymidylate kinase n=1 Tax=Corynebacterium resistens (strain DSM 45100 / JCM 12819 / GTC 2026 / SICGH 158) TaxID=662755 RepID=F8E0Z7_CORRG|nr:dTMP kinase [Corynebacterium resistens]AEI10076.1 Thymidylate kinase [Corynebacterium resistens DSM 45100]